jgi:hypothetical protein
MEYEGGHVMEQQQVPNVTLMHLEGFGVGAVEPTEEYSDEQVEHEATEAQAAVEDEAIVCVDDRPAAGGSKEPVRRKTAAGNLGSAYAGGLLADLALFEQFKDGNGNYTASPHEMLDFTAGSLVNSKMKLGAHTDNHASSDKTNCGAFDGLAPAIGEIPQYADELKPIVAALSADEWDDEAEMMFDKIVTQADKLSTSGYLDGYHSTDALEIVRAHDGIVEVLSGDAKPEEPARHGHLAQSVEYNKIPGYSNRRDGAGMMRFRLDKEAVDEVARVTGRNDYERKKMRIAINTFNAIIVRRLTKNQRVVVIG